MSTLTRQTPQAQAVVEELPAAMTAWDVCRKLAGWPHVLFLDSAVETLTELDGPWMMRVEIRGGPERLRGTDQVAARQRVFGGGVMLVESPCARFSRFSRGDDLFNALAGERESPIGGVDCRRGGQTLLRGRRIAAPEAGLERGELGVELGADSGSLLFLAYSFQ